MPQPMVRAFFHEATFTVSYLVWDPATKRAAIIDSALDFDQKSGRTATTSAQAMLERELGARVISTVLPAEQHYERIAEGQAMFWREGWIADHPDPENFLSLFYGRNAPADSTLPSYLNSTRFRDGVYDSLFAKAVHHGDVAERMMLLAKAESRLMERAVVMPLYHERSVRLLQPWVKDMPINGMEYRDLATVWFDPQLRAAR